MASKNSRWSLWSQDSFLCIGSKGSILSVGSVGSVLSMGSIGSFLSAFGLGDVLTHHIGDGEVVAGNPTRPFGADLCPGTHRRASRVVLLRQAFYES